MNTSYPTEFKKLMFELKDKYGQELFDIDGIGKQLDLHEFSKEFFTKGENTSDVSIDANANVAGKDIVSYLFELPKPAMRLNSYYLLWHYLCKTEGIEKASQYIEDQLTGTIYVNDFVDVGRPYCMNFSCMDIVKKGLPMQEKIKVDPPKHLHAFERQIEQFVSVASHNTLGATGIADVFICMSWFVEKILKTNRDAHFTFRDSTAVWKYVEETITSLVYTLNWSWRGAQSAFTNVSIYDNYFLEELLPKYVFPDGSTPNKRTVQLVQRIFLDVMNKTLDRTTITFPVVSICLSKDENGELRDKTFALEIANKMIKWGAWNIYNGKSSTLSSCCRLRSDLLDDYVNSFGGGASTKIGSIGVVTLNLPRLAVESNGDVELFLHLLSELVREAAEINNAKREIIKKRINLGVLKLYSLGFMSLDRQYSTCGVTGFKEAIELMGYDILYPEGEAFGKKILDVINSVNLECDERFDYPHNVEQVPGESSCVKLAKKDRYLDYACGEIYPFYSNQFIPLTAKADLLDRIRLQGVFDSHFSGGAVAHLNFGERIKDPHFLYELMLACARSGVVYWAANYNYQKCAKRHMSVGLKDTCYCGAPITENYTRVVGFLTKVEDWNSDRRKEDYPNRKWA